MTERIKEQFGKLIDSARIINKTQREIYKKQNYQSKDSIDYAINFCTININIGRGVGKTQYIINHAKANDLILIEKNSDKIYLKPKIKDIKIMSGREIQEQGIILSRFKNFWIDEPQRVFKRLQDLHEFYYNSISTEHEQTYIFLGTPM